MWDRGGRLAAGHLEADAQPFGTATEAALKLGAPLLPVVAGVVDEARGGQASRYGRPGGGAVGPRRLRRLVVPLEGTEASSAPVLEALGRLVVVPVEVIAIHVFTEATVPRMMDRPVRDLEMIGPEFLARHLPGAARVEFRTGAVDRQVIYVCTTEDADLVVLSWSQDTSGGRAGVVRGLLGHCRAPVLLPVASAPSAGSAEAGRSGEGAHPGPSA